MLHAWNLAALAVCLALASLSLVRGLAGMVVVGRDTPGRLEAAALVLAGIVGLAGAALMHHSPG